MRKTRLKMRRFLNREKEQEIDRSLVGSQRVGVMKLHMRLFIPAFILLFTAAAYGDIKPVPPRFDVDYDFRPQSPKAPSEDRKGAIFVTIRGTLEIRLDDGNVISINLKTGEVDWGTLDLSEASICFWQAVTSFFPVIKHDIILDYVYKERPAAISRAK